MVNLTLKFVSCCRASDLMVSTSEVIDCIRQLQLIDFLDEAQYKTTLKTNFVKTRRDHTKFERLYNIFFHEMRSDAGLNDLNPETGAIKDVAEHIRANADEDPMDKAIAEFLAGNPLPFLDAVHQLHIQEEQKSAVLRNNMGQLANRLQVMLQLNKARDKVLQFTGDAYKDAEKVTRQDIEAHFTNLLDSAYSILTKEPRPDNDGLKQIKTTQKHFTQLGDKPFANLSPQEVEELRFVIDQLVRKLKDVATRRFATKNKGILDVKKTLRHSAKFQGVPVEVKFKNKPLRKGKIIALCDVSSSVWSAARFMLNILYALQDCFSRVKSFIFVSGLADVTDFFERYEINEAIEKVLKEADMEYEAPTDYGETFVQFRDNHMHEVNKKTTLIIIGDGRSNYFNPRSELLGEIRDKCRRVIWLNPETMNTWDTGDSEMRTYKTQCHEVRPCQNLNQLMDFIEDLIL